MPEIATAWVTLAVSAQGMQRDIRKAFRDVDADGAGRRAGKDFSAAATGATNLTGIERKLAEVGHRGAQVLGKALKAGALAAGAAAAGAIGTSLKLGFDRLRAIDDAKAKLRGLGNDAATIQKVMDNALASVQGTAFGLGDAAGLAGVIVASGIKPGEELESVLKRVADSAAISGSSLSEMGQIWAKAAAKGRIDGEIVAQLLQRQIPIYEILAKKTGKSADEVAKMVSKGQIDFQTFSDAMNDKVAGAALRTGETVRGSFDNMKAAMGRFGAAIEEPFFKRLPGSFTNLTKSIDDFTPRAKELATAFDAKVFDQWVPAAKNAWEQLAANPSARANIAEIRGIVQSLAGAATRAWPAIAQIAKSLGQASGALGVSSWRLFLTTLEASAGILNALVGPLQLIANLMKNHQGLVTTAAGAWLAFRTVPNLLGRITPVTTGVGTAVSSLGRRLATTTSNVALFSSAYATNMRYLRQGNPNIGTAAAHIATMGNVARSAARGGLGALRGAASGVIGALGGPFSAALIAAGIAVTGIISKNERSAQSFRDVADAADRSREAQLDLQDALTKSAGQNDETVAAAGLQRLRGLTGELNAEASRTGSFLDQFRDSGGSLIGGFRKQIFSFGDNADKNLNTSINQQADTARAAEDAIKKLGISDDALVSIIQGGQPTFDALLANLRHQGDGGQYAAEKMSALRDQFTQAQAAAAASSAALGKLGGDAANSAARVKTAFDAIPKNVPVNINAPGGQDVLNLLTELGEKASTDNEKNIRVEAPLGNDVLQLLKSLGFAVQQNNDKTITVRQIGAEEAKKQIDEAAKDRTATIRIGTAGALPVPATIPRGIGNAGAIPKSDGGIVPMADGGLRYIIKPSDAGLYAGRGVGTLFAEKETGGEAYIPLAAGKRGRSTAILSQVASMFGMSLIRPMADGGIDELRAFDVAVAAWQGDNPSGNLMSALRRGQADLGGFSSRDSLALLTAREQVRLAREQVELLKKQGASTEKIEKAQDKLTKAEDRKFNAEQAIGESRGDDKTKTKSTGGQDASQFGSSLVSGALQELGFDGSVFSDPTQWNNVKSVTAGLSAGLNMLKSAGTAGDDTTSPLASSAGGLNLQMPNAADILKTVQPGPTQLATPQGAAGAAGGAGIGPSIVNNGIIGMDPRQLTQRADAHQNAALRRNRAALP